jgi:peptide/bleomycin uptake transporter
MLREFFNARNRWLRAWAWLGGLSIVGHALMRAYVKYLINDWMGRFYDVGGSAQEVSSEDAEGLAEGSRKITRLLIEFLILCLPSVFVHPLFKFVTNRWVLSWRVALIDAYLERWAAVSLRIENGAQRIHEDTQRFARGLQTCFMTVLDSILTIGVFAPVLIELGSEVQPRPTPSSWLFLVCTGIAVIGLVISVALGWSLVALEVQNQRVEADLRRKLVLHEDRAARPRDVPLAQRMGAQDVAEIDGLYSEHPSIEPEPIPVDLKSAFTIVIDSLVRNYKKLYCRFAAFSLWLGAYEQFVVILPYLIAGPLLFSSANRITLGKVSQVANAFGNVFDALNILSDRWIEVTDWLSVMHRLKEFEVHVYGVSSTRAALIPGVELSSAAAPPLHTERC